MLRQEDIEHIELLLKVKVTDHQRISGGDIANAYKLKSKEGIFFCKQMLGTKGKSILMSEKDGLEKLKEAQAISIPEVYGLISVESSTYLLMEFIETKRANDDDLYKLGSQLANLHTYYNSSEQKYGWHADNYIGSLEQKNNYISDWATFYSEYRLFPQIELSIKKGYFQASKKLGIEYILERVKLHVPEEVKISLLHGDLWNGNYIISKTGVPYIIDPSVYFGHYEIDLAMSRLFGGFGVQFYVGHSSIIDYDKEIDDRIELYQLYYLLVHLNIFGSGYYNSCKSIIDRYF